MELFHLFICQGELFLRLHAIVRGFGQVVTDGKYAFTRLAFGRDAPCHLPVGIGLTIDDGIDAYRCFDLRSTLLFGCIYNDFPTLQQQLDDIFFLRFECNILLDRLRNRSRGVRRFEMYGTHLGLQLGCRIVALVECLSLLRYFDWNSGQFQSRWRHIVTHHRYEQGLFRWGWSDLDLLRHSLDCLIQ